MLIAIFKMREPVADLHNKFVWQVGLYYLHTIFSVVIFDPIVPTVVIEVDNRRSYLVWVLKIYFTIKYRDVLIFIKNKLVLLEKYENVKYFGV